MVLIVADRGLGFPVATPQHPLIFPSIWVLFPICAFTTPRFGIVE